MLWFIANSSHCQQESHTYITSPSSWKCRHSDFPSKFLPASSTYPHFTVVIVELFCVRIACPSDKTPIVSVWAFNVSRAPHIIDVVAVVASSPQTLLLVHCVPFVVMIEYLFIYSLHASSRTRLLVRLPSALPLGVHGRSGFMIFANIMLLGWFLCYLDRKPTPSSRSHEGCLEPWQLFPVAN